MDKLLNKQDIIQFINQEKKKPNIPDIHKSFKLFTKILYKSLYDIYIKIKDLDVNFSNLIDCGVLLIYHVYWTIYTNSYNIKLTMFLTERCVLLFSEFIIMSRNPILNNDLNFIPNINDAMHFSLKKTVGTLKMNYCKNKKVSQMLNYYRDISLDIKYIYQNVLNEILSFHQFSTETKECYIQGLDYLDSNNDILKILEKVSNLINKSLINNYLSIQNNKNKIFNLISTIFHTDYDLIHKIFILRICFELFESIKETYLFKGSDIFISNIFALLNPYKKYLILDNFNNIHKKKFFKDIIKHYTKS